MTRRRRPERFAILAALLVLAQLFGFAHEAAVRHVECAAHGELVEAVDVGATSATTEDSQLVAVGDSVGASEHEHCTIASGLRHGTASPAHTVVTQVQPPVVVAAHIIPLPAEPPSEAPYRFAPKTSPPVA